MTKIGYVQQKFIGDDSDSFLLMHQLCRQFGCLSRCPRVLRVQPPRAGQARSALLGRRYASSGAPFRPNDKFDRLFASLRHGMKEDELARTIAALVLSTRNKSKLEMIETSVPQYIKDFDRQSLFTKVNHYLMHPPEDNFDSLAAQTPTGMITCQLVITLSHIPDRRTRGFIGDRPVNVVNSL